MRFKLLYVVPDFYPSVSGYSNACTGLVSALAASGAYSVDVLTFSKLGCSKELDLPGVRIHRLVRRRMLGSFTVGSELHLSRLMKQMDEVEHYDFVFFETAEFPLAQLYALKRFSDRVIVRIHACAETEWLLFRKELHYRWTRMPVRMFLRNVRNVFSTTPYYIEFVKHWFLADDPLRIAEKRFFVVPNTLPGHVEVAAQTTTTGECATDRIRLVTLGRMDEQGELQKNFGRVLSAVSLLRDKPYFNALELIVVGDGSGRGSLIRLADILGLGGITVFHKSLSNSQVRQLQRQCQAVILASTFEGMSVFALEALANGAPLIAAGNTGLRGLVDDHRNGILVDDPLNEHQIASKLDFFIQELLPRSDAMSDASRRKYETYFSHGAVVRVLTEALQLVQAKNRAGV